MFAYFGMVPPPMFGSAAQPVKPPPVFTAKPQVQTLYQTGGRLTITGAAVSGATALQWQRLDGSQWRDIPGQTAATLSITSATAAQEGTHRLKAVNGNSAPAYSNDVSVINAWLSIVADLSSNTGSDKVTKGSDNFTYTGALVNGQRYYSARLIYASDSADHGRALATWSTSDAATAPISNVSATGQLRSDVTVAPAGKTATLTAKYGNLMSSLKLNG